MPGRRHQVNSRGGRAADVPLAEPGDLFPTQKPGGDSLDALRIDHRTALMSGPLIHGEHAADVGGGGHGRHRAADRANLPGQVIRPAQMAAENGDGKVPALIHHHHGRVRGFAFDVGRDGAHRNAGRPYKYQCAARHKIPPGPLAQILRPGAAAGLAPQGVRQMTGQSRSAFCKGNKLYSHSDASRNSVEKAGWYSWLR